MNKINSVDNEIYILFDFSINLFLSDSYILGKENILNSTFVHFLVKAINESPTRMTTSSSTIINQILTS